MASLRQDSQGGDLGDRGMIESMPDCMETLCPMIGVRELYLDQIEGMTRGKSQLGSAHSGARIGTWEDGLFAYYKSVKIFSANQTVKMPPIAR